MHIWRFITAAVLAAAMLGWWRWGMSVDVAMDLQLRFAYASVLLVFAWWACCLIKALSGRWMDLVLWIGRHKAGMLVAVVCSSWLHVHEPHQLRVFYDEPSHLATALYMHKYHQAATAGSAHQVDGEMYHLNHVPIVRLYAFPTLLSLVHNLAGYRVENVFWLNGLLGLILLILMYRHGQLLGGASGGLLAVLLLTGLPLLAQVVTSGGYDVLNMVLIAAFMLTVRHYLSSPGTQGLDLMLATGVMLALCRYESVLYLLVAVVAAAWKWRRERQVTLTWAAMLSPLAIWPCLTANTVMFGFEAFLSPDLRPEGGGYFGLRYWPSNVSQAIFYLFDFNYDSTNSVLLSVLGGVGLLVALITWLGRRKRRESVSITDTVFVVFALYGSGIYLFVLTQFWSTPTQSSATRFILPPSMMMALAAVVLVREVTPSKVIPKWMPAVAAAFALLVGGTMSAKATQTQRMEMPQVYGWFLDRARENPKAKVLYVSDSSAFMTSHGYASIPKSVLNAHLMKAEQCLEAGIYDEILILEISARDSGIGDFVVPSKHALGSEVHYEVVASAEALHYRRARLLRLIPRPRVEEDPVNGVDRPAIRTHFESDQDRILYRLGLLP